MGDVAGLLCRGNPDLWLLVPMILSPSPQSFGCCWVLRCDGAGQGWAWLHRSAALSILHPTYLRISGVLGLGGGPVACQQEDKKKIISSLEDFSCVVEMSCSLLLSPDLVLFSPSWCWGRRFEPKVIFFCCSAAGCSRFSATAFCGSAPSNEHFPNSCTCGWFSEAQSWCQL